MGPSLEPTWVVLTDLTTFNPKVYGATAREGMTRDDAERLVQELSSATRSAMLAPLTPRPVASGD